MDSNIHTYDISKKEWQSFLDRFTQKHAGSPVQMETYDRETGENVTLPETTLSSLRLDLEDTKNPRINVTVHSGNNEVKHILFRPSQVILRASRRNGDESLTIESVNIETTILLRRMMPASSVDPAA